MTVVRQTALCLSLCGLLAAQPGTFEFLSPPYFVHAASRIIPAVPSTSFPQFLALSRYEMIEPAEQQTFAPGSLVESSQALFFDPGSPAILGSDGVRRPLEREAGGDEASGGASVWFSSPARFRIPSSTPAGLATIEAGAARQQVLIVARRFELFADGRRAEGEPIRLSRAATAGQRITLDGTGLGQSPGEARIIVQVGSARVRPTVTSVPNAPGFDRLEFVLPTGIAPSCFVPLSVEIDGERTRLFRTLPVASPGEVCPWVAGIDAADIKIAEDSSCFPVLSVRSGDIVRGSGAQYSRVNNSGAWISNLALPTEGSQQPATGECSLSRSARPAPLPGNVIPSSRIQTFPSCVWPALGDVTLLDSRNQPVRQPDAVSAAAPWESVPDPAVPAGEYRLRTRLGEFPLSLVQLRWLNRLDAGTLTLDRDYTVVWDTAATRPGDRVDLTLYGSRTSEDFTISCAADATRGVLTLPAWLLRELSADFTGVRGGLKLEMTRPTQYRKLSSGPYRYLVIENRSSEERGVAIP